MRRLIHDPNEAAANIRKFQAELAASTGLQARVGQVHAWYALRQADGNWIFAPSKFIGYSNNSAGDYLATAKNDADGRRTEKTLGQWFTPVDPTSGLGRMLMNALSVFLKTWNKEPRKDVRISVVSPETGLGAGISSAEMDSSILARIVSDPQTCSGRPRIKGTRMPVGDLVALLAHGASKPEILDDYPYLSEEDINAALGYAARIADHRVIRAA